MKFQCLYAFMTIVLFIGCATSVEEKIKSFIPGSYHHFVRDANSNKWDTLTFSSFNEKSRTFLIVRKSGFHRVIKNKLQPKQFTTDTAIGVFDPVTYQVQNPVSGLQYTFLPEQGIMMSGASTFKKLH